MLKELFKTECGTYAFVHSGVEITGFLSSENTIDQYDPADEFGHNTSIPIGYGFQVISTGGGATGWYQKFLLDGAQVHMLITDVGGMTHKVRGADRMLVGVYQDASCDQRYELAIWEQDNFPLSSESNVPEIVSEQKPKEGPSQLPSPKGPGLELKGPKSD